MTAEAPATGEPNRLGTATSPPVVRRAAVVALAIGAIGIVAALTDPNPGSAPLISSPGRGYYLLSIAIAAIAVVLFRALEGREETGPATAAWTSPGLALCGATLLFAGHRSIAIVLLFMILASADILLANGLGRAGDLTAARVARLIVLVAILFLFAVGLLEFRLRTLYAAPFAAFAAAAGFSRLASDNASRPVTASGALVAAVIAVEMVWALGFLYVSTWLAASVWTAVAPAVAIAFSSRALDGPR